MAFFMHIHAEIFISARKLSFLSIARREGLSYNVIWE